MTKNDEREDLGIRHAYIKRGTPQLNGKVERSHRSDGQEFYQLLSYKGDVDLDSINGRTSTTSTDHTEPSKEKRPTKHSEKGYNHMQ